MDASFTLTDTLKPTYCANVSRSRRLDQEAGGFTELGYEVQIFSPQGGECEADA